MTGLSPTSRRPLRVLAIAGSDSGGGAGIQADIKTITMMGGHAMTAIAAVTAQNSRGVTRVDALPAESVVAQIEAVIGDFGVDAIKIGMLGSAGVVDAVADTLGKVADTPIVFDPVMVATSGARLADDASVKAFGRLMRIATLVTPNLPELEALGGAQAILDHGCALVIKGGHEDADEIVDRLLVPGKGEIARWSAPRIATSQGHGTGCTLSSAIATGLGQRLGLSAAVAQARLFVRLALHDAPRLVPVNGPMGHEAVRNDSTQPGLLLNQVTLGCDDFEAASEFYRTLGLFQIVDSPGNGYARFEAGNGVTLSLHRTDKAPGAAVVYFECVDLDARVNALIAKGVVIDQMPRDEEWGWREARLRDPAGNVLCLYFAGENRRYPPWRVRNLEDGDA